MNQTNRIGKFLLLPPRKRLEVQKTIFDNINLKVGQLASMLEITSDEVVGCIDYLKDIGAIDSE